MRVPSRSQCAVMAFVALPLLLFSQTASAQISALSGAGGTSTSSASQLSDVPITAPVAVETPDAPAPAPQLDAEPMPAAPPVASSEALGPTSSSATAGFHVHSSAWTHQQLANGAAAAHGGFGTDGVLMIVGGAAFIAGLIIGGGAGTAIAIAGAVMALYGLYLYLR